MTHEQRTRLARAIAEAEDGTTGRIAVRVIADRRVDALERAKHEFARSGLHRHDAANAALLLIAPRARRFAVVGDRALDERVGEAFWTDLTGELQPYFARGAVAEGALHAVGRIGEALRTHFPTEREPS